MKMLPVECDAIGSSERYRPVYCPVVKLNLRYLLALTNHVDVGKKFPLQE
jgi:hypothetical protein